MLVSKGTRSFNQRNALSWSVYPPGNAHISHLGKRKFIFKSADWQKDMLVPWRVDMFEAFHEIKVGIELAQQL